MSVATETDYAERIYTGAETSLTPGFTAEADGDVTLSYLDASGLPVALTRNTHFSVSRDSGNNVTVNRIAFPAATPSVPVTMLIARNTAALQGVSFVNLNAYDASIHETLFDRAFRILAEVKGRVARYAAPFFTTDAVVDFRPRRIKAADPVDDSDLATRLYVLTVTGILNLQGYVTQCAASAVAAAASALAAMGFQAGSETARDKSQAWSETAENTPVQSASYSAFHWSQKAAASAASVLSLFNNPDDGIFGDVESGPIDDGVF